MLKIEAMKKFKYDNNLGDRKAFLIMVLRAKNTHTRTHTHTTGKSNHI